MTVLVSLSAVLDSTGSPVGASAIVRDITEYKRTEALIREREVELTAIYENAPLIMLLLDEDQHVAKVNEAAKQSMAAGSDGLAKPSYGEAMRCVHALEDSQGCGFGSLCRDCVVREIIRNTFETGRSHHQVEATLPLTVDGQSQDVTFLLSTARLAVHGRPSVLVTIQDISERKLVENELEKAKEAAESANRTKDHFLAALSHELRTPLTPVVLAVSMLQRRPGLDQDLNDTLEMIRRNVEMEARLIDDLLDVTRIASGKIVLRKQCVEVCKAIERAVEVCRPDIEARGLDFGVDLGPAAPYWVESDLARIQQVCWNLLKNAIKFTPHGGHVGIRCWPEDEHVVLEVADSGIGIEPESLPRLFTAFEQVERSITQRFGGLGLGLAISKSLVEQHGGTISAYSEGKGKGATFRVRLPLCEPAGQAERPATTVPAQRTVRPLRILLVEDHGATAKMIQAVLKEMGHTLEMAGDMATALELAKQDGFDLLLSDLGLPDGSGHDLMRQLRKRGHSFPGIALSGYGQDDDIQRSCEAGFAAHLTKPASREAIVEAVAAVAAGEAIPSTYDSARTSQLESPVFDVQAALNRCLGTPDLLAQMIGFFLNDVDILLPQIRAALQQSDLAEVGRLAHKLKNTMTHLAAERAEKPRCPWNALYCMPANNPTPRVM